MYKLNHKWWVVWQMGDKEEWGQSVTPWSYCRSDRWAWSPCFSFPLFKKHNFMANISQKLPSLASLQDTEERKQMHDGPDFLLNMYFDWVQSPNWQTPCGKTICLRVQLLAFLLSDCVLVNIWDVSDRNQAHDGIKMWTIWVTTQLALCKVSKEIWQWHMTNPVFRADEPCASSLPLFPTLSSSRSNVKSFNAAFTGITFMLSRSKSR